THLYDPQDEIDFAWTLVKLNNKITVSYSLASTDKGSSPELYMMEWEERESYSQRQGAPLRTDSILLAPGQKITGDFEVNLREEPWMLFLKIVKVTNSKIWSYPFLIEKNYPVNGFIKEGDQKVLSLFVKKGNQYTIVGPSDKINLSVYFYSKEFTSAFPPFSKSTAGADPILLHDSTFTIKNGSSIAFSREGLYLVQADTSSAEGFAFRVAASAFPKYTRIQDLVEPMVFICTRDEFDNLLEANGDKVQFDKTVLGITKDKDRARRFMRSYYNRVELANQFFGSYKEGWKTDQGMIFIIFGLPDEIRKTAQNEIWYYKNSRTKFVFIKKGSVYDPNYYVLMRDDRFTQIWYNTIDLWRKSRF
ncbi:MAG: GWxTD domain-containing protein, partial [Cyclobacteriaceae bacterium]